MIPSLDARPIVIAIAGPNGAGKSTFFEAHLGQAGLRFVNADDLARELGLGPYEAASAAAALRATLLEQRESFVFETVFSDPSGDKIRFLRDAAERGYTVVLCYIGIASADLSEERVSIRVMQGGHDVPSEKIAGRFPRVLLNLGRAIRELPLVLVYDNSSLARPFREVAVYEKGVLVRQARPLPAWLPRI